MITPNIPEHNPDLKEQKEDVLSIFSAVDRLAPHYEQLVLVADHGQAQLALSEYPNALIVTSDWLSWRQLRDAGNHAIHFEAMLETWQSERGDPNIHALSSCGWRYQAGADISVFQQVSLGRQLNRHAIVFCNSWQRLWHALDRLCTRVTPNDIVFFDIRTEFGLIDRAATRALVADVARHHGMTTTNRSVGPRSAYSTYPVDDMILPKATAATESPLSLRAFIRRVFLILVSTLSVVIRRLGKDRPVVFLYLNWLGIQNLFTQFNSGNIRPVTLVGSFPKSIGYIARCLWRGISLVELPNAQLNEKDHVALAQLRQQVDAQVADDPVQAALLTFLTEQFIHTPWLEERAIAVKRYAMFFKTWNIARTVVGDGDNSECSLITETARAFGADTDELLNGLFMSGLRTDSRCVDHNGTPPHVGRLLSWGAQNEAWLQKLKSPLPHIRVGYPSIDLLRRNRRQRAPAHKRALLLPIIPSGDDIGGVYCGTFEQLVALPRHLASLGFDEIKVKLHPGHLKAKTYIDAILTAHNVTCEVAISGSLEEYIAWADIVIGPVNSGSFVETLALGKVYFPFNTHPSSLDPDLFGAAFVLHSKDDLAAALDTEKEANGDTVLDSLCSTKTIPNSSAKFWSVMEDALVPHDC